MLYSQYILRDCLIRLENISGKIKEESAGEVVTNEIPKIIGIMLDLIKGCEENFFYFERSEWYNDLKEKTINSLNTVHSATIGKQIKDVITSIIAIAPESHDYNAPTLYDINSWKRGYAQSNENINRDVISSIFNKCLGVQDRPFNLLDIKCSNGILGETIKSKYKDIRLYGIEKNPSSAERAKSHYTKIAKGTVSGAKISNEVFDVMFMNPELTLNLNSQITFPNKTEKLVFQDTNKYIRPNGLLMLVIPYFKLYKDICYQIAKYYKDIKIYRLYGDDFQYGARILLTGIRKKNNDLDPVTYNYLREYKNPLTFQNIANDDKINFKVPDGLLEVKLFRGSVLDMDEMSRIVNNSNLLEDFLAKQDVEKSSQSSIRPLQPFNIGQIGLVLTSGCLDGIVDEGGTYHAIKGRVAKKVVEERKVHDGKAEIVRTTSNKVEINVVLPDGTYKTLA